MTKSFTEKKKYEILIFIQDKMSVICGLQINYVYIYYKIFISPLASMFQCIVLPLLKAL